MKSKAIKINSDVEMTRLLDLLASDILDAHCKFRLLCKLGDSFDDYSEEMGQSNTFWHLVTDSLKESAFLHLCRVYDQEKKGLGLRRFLETLKYNRNRFSPDEFRKRLIENKQAESLVEISRIPTEDEINADINLTDPDGNPLVKKLVLWRGNMIAHKSATVAMGKSQILVDSPVSSEEINCLLRNALDILNKYSQLFRASTHSSYMIGQDDYRALLEFIRIGLRQRRIEQGCI